MAMRSALRRDMAARLRAAGIPGADLDARLLTAHALDIAAADLLIDRPVAPHEAAQAAALMARRLAGEPVARILGEKEFWSLPFVLAPETLVPRPDTETVVEEALSGVSDRSAPLCLLDLGTGSGAILAALLTELPGAFGIGVDRAFGAARVARDNLARLGLGARTAILVGDWAGALKPRFDLVVSNPPYIRSDAIAGLDREVREHDPIDALDGGADGLQAYQAIARDLPRLLAPGGRVVLELGVGQEDAVSALLAQSGLTVSAAARRDLSGIARALSATLPLDAPA
ncbi:peptide chain release factor N(5)-glutamine methyltransferase [Aquabacter spiritensis]|uniref:Release factor glutamine methyltransferase n=1 Tax=Aquabacter spiritensis TaxID=933073 RepID=A0A4R3LQT6_9HYPH|nr:peptide chain release factor N(5)-glutamine methyltransferase [Aquabacter spiritensis]TCT02066.1 release factor glutamine methyltransferase [Aquabacter spiritensis]